MIGKVQSPALPSLPEVSGVWQALKRNKLILSLAALLLIAAIVAGSLVASRSNTNAAYVTQPVARQDLTQAVTASGTVNPQNTVNVGTQVSGTISAIYVDYNSKVHQGQVLARLDTSQLQAQLDQANATLQQAQAQANAQSQTAGGAQANVTGAQAGIESAQAGVSKAQSALNVAQETMTRDNALLAKGYIAQSQVDADQANEVAAQSALTSAQAAVTQARAQTDSSSSAAGAALDTASAAQAGVAAAQAQVQQDELNIQRAVITSPIDGTVIARDVSVGQTVAASLQTPTLFSIAQNLHKMEVDISVGEPDIGNVRPGDVVSFSVLAFPNQTFSGTVSQVRVNPTTVNNVVTYDVITLVNNPNGQLLPGMTANATINVQTAKNALVVPTQALSFRPSSSSFTHRKHSTTSTAAPQHGAASTASPWGQTAAGVSGTASAGGTSVLFVEQNGKPVPVRVRVDLVSGTQAAVTPLRGTLAAGDNVIVSSGSSSSQTTRASSLGSRGPGGMSGLGRALH
ncbi:MAG TPA: efflux RND transporter periplasmic adaptor subunit [Candidatus Baltobacteraceae bacterium]|nr:efflux RND transporter periplasmic adaptor subunit [Candidatus Baltobacteraceae bacterium]